MESLSLHSHLASLYECLDSNASVQQSKELAADLCRFLMDSPTDSNISLCLSVLYTKEKNLLDFLRKAIFKEELRECKIELISFMRVLHEHGRNKLLPFAVKTKDCMLAILKSEKYADVKCSAFPLLVTVLDLVCGTDKVEEMDIKTVVESLFYLLLHSTKIASSVKSEIHRTFGLLCKLFPEYLLSYQTKILEVFLRSLKLETESSVRKPDLQVIAGSLDGLTFYLSSFTQSVEEGTCFVGLSLALLSSLKADFCCLEDACFIRRCLGSAFAPEIFQYAKKAIKADIDFTRYAVPKAALELFAQHSEQFSTYLLNEYDTLFARFSYWCRHTNYELRKVALRAMNSFLVTISEMLVSGPADENKKKIFKFFMSEFKKKMNEVSLQNNEMPLAVRGYGSFAAACRNYGSSADVKLMFDETLAKAVFLFFNIHAIHDDRLYHLASFLESLALILAEMNTLEENSMYSLERLIVLMIDGFPKINPKFWGYVSASIIKLFLSIERNFDDFNRMFSETVYQSVVLCCSYPTIYAEETEEEAKEFGRSRRITCHSFFKLWALLLDVPNLKELRNSGFSMAERTSFQQTLYNEIMTSSLRIFAKLNLNLINDNITGEVDSSQHGDSATEKNHPDTLGVSNLKPIVYKDYEIFVNLVDFVIDIVENAACPNLFAEWVYPYLSFFITHAESHELISGFYKIIALVLRVIARLKLFEDIENCDEDSMDTSECSDTLQRDKDFIEELIKSFTLKLISRAHQFKDELLVSCIEYVLSLPVCFVHERLNDFSSFLQCALKIGLVHLRLASMCLSTLQKWSNHMNPDTFSQFIKPILPYFDDYLRIGRSEKEITDAARSTVQSMNLTYEGRGRKKISSKLNIYFRTANQLFGDSELYNFQKRVIDFIGSLGGDTLYSLLDNYSEIIKNDVISWSKRHHLFFPVPFVDAKPLIRLDVFLPRIAELALSSTDKQIKTSASESLHSIILYMIGRNAYFLHSGSQKDYYLDIFEKIFPVLIEIGSAVDQMSNYLFTSLFLQIIAWLTSCCFGSNECETLLHSIMDGLTSPSTSKRDFSTQAFAHYVKWSFKTARPEVDEKLHNHLCSLIERICNLATHSNTYKRLGACLAWNATYMLFREKQALMDKYIFIILHRFVECLAMAENDDQGIGTVHQGKLALQHVDRIITHNANSLCTESKTRLKPPAWTLPILDVAVRWLIRMCCREEEQCRTACMNLLKNFIPCLNGKPSVNNYFERKGANYFIERFEGFLDSDEKPDFKCVFSRDNFKGIAKSLVEWTLKSFYAMTDCYWWVLKENYLSPDDIFLGSHRSQLLELIKLFINMCCKNGTDYVVCMGHRFSRLCSRIILRSLQIISLILRCSPAILHEYDILNNDIFVIISFALFAPSSLGFDKQTVIHDNELEVTMKSLLETGLKLATADSFTSYGTKFKDMIMHSKNRWNVVSLLTNEKDLYKPETINILNGYKILFECRYETSDTDKVFDLLWKRLQESGNTLGARSGFLSLNETLPIDLKCFKFVLRYAFAMSSGQENVIFDFILKKETLMSPAFAEELMNWLVLVERRVKKLLNFCKNKQTVFTALNKLLTSFALNVNSSSKSKQHAFYKEVLLQLVDNRNMWAEDAVLDAKIVSINLMAKTFLTDATFATKISKSLQEKATLMYCFLLQDSSVDVNSKLPLFDLLSIFFSFDGEKAVRVTSALNMFVAANFPLRSSEFVEGCSDYNTYISCMNKFRFALTISTSIPLFLFLFKMIIRDEKEHVMEASFLQAMKRFFEKLPIKEQETAVTKVYEYFMHENTISSGRRLSAVSRVLLPVLASAEYPAVIAFYTSHVVDIIKQLDVPVKGSQEQMKSEIELKTGCLLLLQFMFGRLLKEDVFSKSSKVCEKYARTIYNAFNDGKEMVKDIIRKARKLIFERFSIQDKETIRVLHCQAFNVLIYLFVHTQTEPKLFYAFLFKEDASKNEFIFESILDLERKYTFPLLKESVADDRNNSKKLFDVLHPESRRNMKSANLIYPSSQFLIDSTLQHELNFFDFTGVAPNPIESFKIDETAYQSGKKRESSEFSRELQMLQSEINLASDELNNHECMVEFVFLLRFMLRNKITPSYDRTLASSSPMGFFLQSQLATEMPLWVQFLYRKLNSNTTAPNVKLFIMRLILNSDEVFRPYSRFLYSCMLSLLLNEDFGFDNMNYLIIETIVTLLCWSDTNLPAKSECPLITSLLDFLFRHCYHENRQVLKNNIEVIKAVVECWRELIIPPTQSLYSLIMKNTGADNKKKIYFTHVIGILLANGINACSNDSPIDMKTFYAVLFEQLKDRLQVVYGSAADVIGLLLRFISDSPDLSMELPSFETDAVKILSQLPDEQQLFVLSRIKNFYPKLAQSFVRTNVLNISKFYGSLKILCADCITAAITNMNRDLFDEIKEQVLMELLRNRDPFIQASGLRMLLCSIAYISPSDCVSIIPIVSQCQSNYECRTLSIDIFMNVFDKYKDDTSEYKKDIMKYCTKALVQYLSDGDESLRWKAQNFWSNESRLPRGTLNRLLDILRYLHSPAIEDAFLSNATNLLLELTSLSPDYNRAIFENSLGSCQFQEVNVPVGSFSYGKSRTLVPYFIQNSKINSTAVLQTVKNETKDFLIKATNEPAFTPTVRSDIEPFNWITQKPVSSSIPASLVSSSTETSLLSDFTQAVYSRSQRKRVVKLIDSSWGAQAKKLKQSPKEAEESELNNRALLRLKRTFYKDVAENSRTYFMNRQASETYKRRQYLSEFKQNKQENIHTLRKYRAGELPDIQIKAQDIIAPLQSLAQDDPLIARLLFVELFRAIVDEISVMFTDVEFDDLCNQMSELLEDLIDKSEMFRSNFISAVLEIQYHFIKKMKINPTTISSVALNASCELIGIQVLEEYLGTSEKNEETQHKIRKSFKRQQYSGEDSQVMIELSRLYRSIGFYDDVRGIFSFLLRLSPESLEAIRHEFRNDFLNAKRAYRTLLNNQNCLNAEKDFYLESYISCCEKLGLWTEIDDICLEQGKNKLMSLTEDSYSLEYLLPKAFRAKTKLLLTGNEEEQMKQQSLLDFISELSEFPDKLNYIQTRFATELALICVHQNDLERAKYFSNISQDVFLEEWTQVSKLLEDKRTEVLSKVQLISELKVFLSSKDSAGGAAKILKWRNVFPSSVYDKPELWDDVITNRSVYFNMVGDSSQTDRAEITLYLKYAKSACKRKSFNLALSVLKKTRQIMATSDSLLKAFSNEWLMCYIDLHLSKSQRLSPYEGFRALITSNTLRHEKSLFVDDDGKVRSEKYLLYLKCCETIINHLTEDKLAFGKLSKDDQNVILSFFDSNEKTVCESPTSMICICVKEICKLQADTMNGELCMAFARFCDRYLRAQENGQMNFPECLSLYPSLVVTSMLRALNRNEDEARKRLPRLIQILELYPDVCRTFISHAAEVPSWRYLDWISQITAVLSKPYGKALFDTVKSIAKDYPQALVFPFRLSMEAVDISKLDTVTVNFLNSISKQLKRVPFVDVFIAALEQFESPDMTFKDWKDTIYLTLKTSKMSSADITKKIEELIKSVFSPTPIVSGSFRFKFSAAFKSKFEAIARKFHTKLNKMSITTMEKEFQALQNEMSKFCKNPSTNLIDYSIWLKEYSLIHGKELEIPGQYTGKKKPYPEEHVKICGFDEQVITLSSLRKPKKIVIRGNDGKDYSFLVKTGEDLRQDQRIESLFDLISEIMDECSDCRKRNLRIRVYQVIPINAKTGMIEWVSNTSVLREIIERALTENEKKQYHSRPPVELYQRKIMQACENPKASPATYYGEMFKNYDKEIVRQYFTEVQSMIPGDLLKRGYFQLCRNVEGFFILRTRFTTSLAALSSALYVLGVGDRHQSNYLIDTLSGQVIGIDFGYAFGYATTLLPVPELIPFRLTRQIMNMMGSINLHGLFRESMIYSLRSIQENSDLLLCTMNVFVKEPSVDWISNALKNAMKQGNIGEKQELGTEYSSGRIRSTSHRLSGKNPVEIFCTDLCEGVHSTSKYLKYMMDVVKGSSGENFRSKLPANKSKLTVEEEVDCLIDLATDVNILGRTWAGWEPFM